MAYAKRTKVSEKKTQADILAVLEKHECDGCGTYCRGNRVQIGFEMGKLKVEMTLDLSPAERELSDAARNAERRRLWRALFLSIKAKLVAVEEGISTIEQEFMPFVVCNDGRTIGEHMGARLLEARESGSIMPIKPILLALPSA